MEAYNSAKAGVEAAYEEWGRVNDEIAAAG
jgi:hypothetical protein